MKLSYKATMGKTLLIIAVLCLICNCAGNRVPTKLNPSDIHTISSSRHKELITSLKSIIPQMMDEVEIPGLSIALISDSGVIWQGNFGVLNTSTMKPVDDSTIFVAASFSKVVFAYLVLRLVDEDKISLDKPLIYYAPKAYIEEEFKSINDERFNQITARMVLTHSTGFPDQRLFGGSVKINFTPGSDFSYSGEAFELLQKVVEHIEGKYINDVIKEKVFIPLGMKNSSFVYEKRFEGKQAKGHNHFLSFLFNWKMLSNDEANVGRSLLTTTEDFSKFLISLMNGSKLKKDTYCQLLTPQINANSKSIFWGLGIGIEVVKNDTTYWHDGEGLIFENYFAFKKNDVGFVYFSNSANGLSIGAKITEIILPGYHPSFDWLGIEQNNFQ